MILVNEIMAAEAAMDSGDIADGTQREFFRTTALMLAPFAPFLAQELWTELGHEGVVFRQAWPVADAELAQESEIEVPVQVNGKLVVIVRVAADADTEAMKAAAHADAKVTVGCRQDGGEGGCGSRQARELRGPVDHATDQQPQRATQGFVSVLDVCVGAPIAHRD